MKRYIVAVDIGTTSTKSVVIDQEGGILASHSVEYPLMTPAPDRAEQNPDEILHAAVTAVKAALTRSGIQANEVHCLSMSSAMLSLIAMDKDGSPLTPCITWADNRSNAYVQVLHDRHDAFSIYSATGTPIHPMSPLLKLMWMKDNDPVVFHKAHKFIGIKSYILHRWFGRYVVDESIASASGLYGLHSRNWHEPSLLAAGIEADRLAELVPTTFIMEGMNPSWAEKLGIHPDVPVVIGASDGVLANVGIGSTEPDSYAVTIGTSGAVRAVVKHPLTDPQARTFCYALTKDRWVVGGAMNNGGVLLRWARDELASLEVAEARAKGVDPYVALMELAEQAPAGSGGLVVLPLFAGERAPYWNADVRGMFFGLSLAHRKSHMVRAVLEGICYAVRSVAVAVEAAAGKPAEIRASGGFARSPFWRQTLTDIVGAPLTVPDAIESSSLGAAALGLHALGEMPDLAAARSWSLASSTHMPNENNQRIYRELFALYQDLYPRLIEPFKQIAAIQKNESTTRG